MNLENLVESYKDDIIRTTQELVRIKSVEEDAKPNMPFGEGPNKALVYSLKVAEEMGFEVKNVDGYAGHGDIGEGKETVGILVHLDVVPEGDGWTYPPYGAEIHDNKIFGRGTIDDKGPAVAALYAMKAIKESNLEINKKIRIILGTNEETGWGGINYYLEKEKTPDLAITPDADFPVIHGEKGILDISLVKEFNEKNTGDFVIKRIVGGNRPNMVPDSCTAMLKVNNENKDIIKESLEVFKNQKGYKLSLKESGDEIEINCIGKSAHGSTPEAGENAISHLLYFLGTLSLDRCDITEFIELYNQKIGLEYNGQSIGCGLGDDISGKLTFNVGIINLDQNNAELSINIRYPIKNSNYDVVNGIEEILSGTGVVLVQEDHLKPIYFKKDHFLVQKLMEVYRDITNDKDSEPITIGGGTYARAMDNAVAFGPLFPGEEELAHQKDENISIENLIKITKIYARALYELAK